MARMSNRYKQRRKEDAIRKKIKALEKELKLVSRVAFDQPYTNTIMYKETLDRYRKEIYYDG